MKWGVFLPEEARHPHPHLLHNEISDRPAPPALPGEALSWAPQTQGQDTGHVAARHTSPRNMPGMSARRQLGLGEPKAQEGA
jgi:hypothetical protein